MIARLVNDFLDVDVFVLAALVFAYLNLVFFREVRKQVKLVLAQRVLDRHRKSAVREEVLHRN